MCPSAKTLSIPAIFASNGEGAVDEARCRWVWGGSSCWSMRKGRRSNARDVLRPCLAFDDESPRAALRPSFNLLPPSHAASKTHKKRDSPYSAASSPRGRPGTPRPFACLHSSSRVVMTVRVWSHARRLPLCDGLDATVWYFAPLVARRVLSRRGRGPGYTLLQLWW